MSKKKKKVTKYLNLKGIGKQIKLDKISQINLSNDKEFIYIEKLKSGEWLLAYTNTTIDDIEKLEAIEIKDENIPL